MDLSFLLYFHFVNMSVYVRINDQFVPLNTDEVYVKRNDSYSQVDLSHTSRSIPKAVKQFKKDFGTVARKSLDDIILKHPGRLDYGSYCIARWSHEKVSNKILQELENEYQVKIECQQDPSGIDYRYVAVWNC